MKTEIRQLALDALNFRMDATGSEKISCFINNRAGEKLRQSDANAIPILEEIIRESIVPAMADYRAEHGLPNWDSLIREGPRYAGLGDFLGAYWTICARHAPTLAIDFMQRMTRPVITEAVAQLAVFFHPQNQLAGVELPAAYVDYIKALRKSDVGEFRDVATYVINRLGLSNSQQIPE